MIRIAFVDLELPDGWLEKKDTAEKAIEDCADAADRRDLLAGYLSDVWKDLREHLAMISYGKCWYCETSIVRDDLVVDHYRPKGRVYEEASGNEGYWWLAFEQTNFRLSCKYCNEWRVDRVTGVRGGKATHFPLLEGSVRATATDRSLSREYPVILDPIVKIDVDCLMFLADSRAWPKYSEDVDPTNFYRAKRTVEILNLNHTRLRKTRSQICNQVAEGIVRCDAAYRNYLSKRASTTDPVEAAQARQPFEDAMQRLDDFLKSSSPYAGAARSVVRRARADEGREWVEALL